MIKLADIKPFGEHGGVARFQIRLGIEENTLRRGCDLLDILVLVPTGHLLQAGLNLCRSQIERRISEHLQGNRAWIDGGGGGVNRVRDVLGVKSVLIPRELVKTQIVVEGRP